MIYLEPEQLHSLRNEARSRRISLAELIRRLVGDHLGKDKSLSKVSEETYLKIVGLGASGKKDVSADHDRYLGKALRDEHPG